MSKLMQANRRKSKIKAVIDMMPLIDLTFLLLITFIITMPALEQAVTLKLPVAQADVLPTKKRKANTISIDGQNRIFLNNKSVTMNELEEQLLSMVAEDAEVPVLVRGDERLSYGQIMQVVKIVYKSKVHRMALVTAAD